MESEIACNLSNDVGFIILYEFTIASMKICLPIPVKPFVFLFVVF